MAALTPRVTAALAVVVALALATPVARADDDPSEPPGSVTTSPPPEVDANSPGLKLAAGATLAPAKVLDIKSVVEDLGGEERREDTNENVTFALQAEVLFPKDSAKLNPQARSRIEAIAAEIKAQSATKVRVFGFTDDLGSYAHGLTLSKKRAEAVHDILAGDLDGDVTFEVRGYSEDYPIADNSSEEGRKKNRRVEVSFPRTASGTGGEQS
ncbi:MULTISPECIES: OmpA family protein [Streptomyces]|uniref:OmpA family protein n=1 Tax=Streptomyces heilongjiangensis TaxID=945052 RepID=A0ABW1B0U6_9ACTN|nr:MULTISPECIES: OmpA family protein [Streptomyces]MDC2945672.1 OmpA family protein [Streptomyces heilongjiangensis]